MIPAHPPVLPLLLLLPSLLLPWNAPSLTNRDKNGDSSGRFRLGAARGDWLGKIWDFSEGGAGGADCLKTLRGHDHNVSCVAWIPPAGDMLVSCSRDQTIKFWEVMARALRFMRSSVASRLALRCDFRCGPTCCSTYAWYKPSCNPPPPVLQWTEHLPLYDHHHHHHTIEKLLPFGVTMSRDNASLQAHRRIVPCPHDTSPTRSCVAPQAATGYCTRTLKGDSEWVRRVALSDDGEMLASCGNDQSVKVRTPTKLCLLLILCVASNFSLSVRRKLLACHLSSGDARLSY